MKISYSTGLVLWFMLINCGVAVKCVEAETHQVAYYTVRILRTLPHSTKSYTQGLVFYQGMLYESTGHYGRSTLQRIDATTGIVQQSLAVPDVFGEGLARWGNRLVQLTWREHTAFVYDIQKFSNVSAFHYDTEGWGLTTDESQFVMSDGSDTLFFRDPFSFDVVRTVKVTLNNTPLDRINELEYIEGLIYANVWGEDHIVQIDPANGKVRGIIDAGDLVRMQPALGSDSVLNGIAYDPEQKTLYLTGKNWPSLFEVTLEQKF